MKRLTTTLFALIIALGAMAQGVAFEPEGTTLEQASAKAKAENKLIFLDCYTQWCGPCKKMAREIFPQQKVGDYFNQNFVCIKLDAEKEGREAAKKFGVTAYPTFKVIATTLRQVKTATCNDWSAIAWGEGKTYKAKDYPALDIFDRVGGGDSFASGLIYGLMTTGDVEKAVNYGAAHGALAMTTPGDTSMASLKEVEAVMGGAGARVKR